MISAKGSRAYLNRLLHGTWNGARIRKIECCTDQKPYRHASGDQWASDVRKRPTDQLGAKAGSSVATLGPVPSTSDFSTHSLASTSSVVTSSNSEAVPTNRPVTRRQKRIANAAAQTSLSPEPPDPPIALSPSSSDSSSVIAMDDPELSLSFNKDLEIDSESIAVPSETIIDSSLDALQVVREVRTDMEAANIPLMALSVNDSIRQDIASTPETAFSFDDTDSKIIDYLDLLFDAQNLLYQHRNVNIFPNTSLCNTR
ncbi:hypothetical protein AVEN_117454-1 [Araneus ventricosus]|uniref:Uncharacterized protein n=1 Tax=Araneus ventricosus TaxID=182803 RepID=A0A4Y2X157_ARAVE|nr:hypothetical protein AVEN_117454-1 [Araneus ventricosus]